MFERVLIATDLSAASDEVVNCLCGMTALGMKHCLLLQILSLREAGSLGLSYEEDLIKNRLKEQKNILSKKGVSVETRVEIGSAKREINRIAKREDYSLIAVGSRGHSRIVEPFLGEIAYSVVRKAKIPVLVIKLSRRDDGEVCYQKKSCDPLGNLLFPTDLSSSSNRAFDVIKQMVSAGARSITLMHVLDAKGPLDEAKVLKDLGRMKGEIQEQGAEVDLLIARGDPEEEILRAIEDRDINLVVMGKRGYGYLEGILVGSVSEKVIHRSEASLLIV
jgi:nucleotide-binding universal stress UspA family protein